MDPFSDATREVRRTQEAAALWHGWYQPWVHLLGPSAIGLAGIVLALFTLDDVHPAAYAVVPALWVVANAAEWRVHKTLLHRAIPGFYWLYERHTLMHHRVFVTWDMPLRNRGEWGLILLPPFAIVLLVLATVPPACGVDALGAPNAARLGFVTAAAYLLSYEWLHLAYHLPTDSRIGKLGFIRYLRRLHASHHDPKRMATSNFNVTVPLWDWVRGHPRSRVIAAETAIIGLPLGTSKLAT